MSDNMANNPNIPGGGAAGTSGAASGAQTPGHDPKTQADRASVEEQLSRLREDVSSLSDAVRSLATHGAEDVRRQASALRDDVRQRGEAYLRQAQDAASDLEEDVTERIRAEPIKSVLIAAGIGYLYARLFR
ncbi:DUF883 family protein [Jiella pacifica]|uniref:DUF883 family protein n=1 Tax=Jiella pacifica TaxID=2696469 RepID=A0A6N9TBM2_9HYPH|nr:DUF883 family protein [Jiella pacifica]NDW07079.1 DUF883 family protein [Jiella pacifica]